MSFPRTATSITAVPSAGVSARASLRSFAAMSLIVVALHFLLLQNAPLALASMVRKEPADTLQGAVFSTRMLAPLAPVPSEPDTKDATPVVKSRPIAQPHRAQHPPSSDGASVPMTSSASIGDALVQPEPAIDAVAASTKPVRDLVTEPGILLAAAGNARPETTKPATKTIEAQDVRQLAVPAPLRIKYEVKGEVKGFPYYANGELLWEHDGVNYAARLEISHFILGSRAQTSKGALTPQGLEPVRFGDKVRSEVAAHFERAKGKVSFSANAPDVPLQAGAQDQLSLFMQIASMMGGDPTRFTPGAQIPFQAIGPRSSEQWIFKVAESEVLKLAGMELHTVKLTRDANGEYDPRGEVWLAAELGYLPVRIRLIQPNGDFVEQNMRSAQKP